MALTGRDILDLCFCVGTLLVLYSLHKVIRSFIDDKPEGRKTVLARVYVIISWTLEYCGFTVATSVIQRIVIGKLQYPFLLWVNWSYKFSFIAIVFLFAFSFMIKVSLICSFKYCM